MQDDRKIKLHDNFPLKGIFGISIKILYLLDRHDMLLDVNHVL